MKLQFEENEYYLMKDGEELAIATTDELFIKELDAERLSVENCDAIYCEAINYGYDLGDLDEIDVEIETIEYGLGNDENGRPVFETRNILDEDGLNNLKRNKMEASELRIGNHLNYKDSTEIAIVSVNMPIHILDVENTYVHIEDGVIIVEKNDKSIISYSEEEVFKLICNFNYDLQIDECKDIKEWFEQFKKK